MCLFFFFKIEGFSIMQNLCCDKSRSDEEKMKKHVCHQIQLKLFSF